MDPLLTCCMQLQWSNKIYKCTSESPNYKIFFNICWRRCNTKVKLTGKSQTETLVTLSRLHFPDRYKPSDWRFCACAINVKSSICSETTKHFWYKCRGLFIKLSCDDYCEELLKMSFNTIASYVCLNHCHGLWRNYSHMIYACYQNMSQDLFVSC